MTGAILGGARLYMRSLTAVAGVSTVLWVALASLIAGASPVVGEAWGVVGSVLTAAALLGTLLGAALSPIPSATRLRWIAYSLFVVPFGATCFWTWAVGREPNKNSTLRQTLYVLVGTIAAILLLALAAQVNPTRAELWMRAGAALACVLVLWHGTLVTRGRSVLVPLAAIGVAVALLMAVNRMGFE